jgi:hypothetical protein
MDRVTRAPLIGRYGLARPDERWTGPSIYFLPPDPQRYLQTTNVENASLGRGNPLHSLDRASNDMPAGRHSTPSSERSKQSFGIFPSLVFFVIRSAYTATQVFPPIHSS